jgi:hypothetical protein
MEQAKKKFVLYAHESQNELHDLSIIHQCNKDIIANLVRVITQ